MSSAPAFASPEQAIAMLRSAAGYLALADATQMAAESQARALAGLEQLDAMQAAARASLLRAFTAAKAYQADGDYSPRSWLMHRTRITRSAAAAHLAWARRAAAHPLVIAALAAGDVISESHARTICGWTDRLPGNCVQAADEILLTAAGDGADLRALAEFAAEIYARSLPAASDDEPEEDFDDRAVRVETTFGGAGVITGNLTAECASVVSTVLDALSAPQGADDTRTHEQRFHDGLQEAMRRLIAADLLPERAGQPTKGWVHVSLAELRAMDLGSALQQEWISAVRGRWAAARAGASVAGSDGSAWLEGEAARAMTCDASLTPVVTGDVDLGVLDDLVRLCVQLDRVEHAAPARPREALRQAIIGKAVDLLSGPGGLASFLRTRQLGARLAGPSVPLDIGYSKDVPAGIRNAVILRAKGRCEWAGRCNQPAAACEVHHVKHKANGGTTSVSQCILLCFYHHQVMIHRMGWTLVVNPDGTTTAWNPGRTKVLHSHGPPARAG